MKKWTKKELDFLIKNYPNRGRLWCCKKLKRSDGSIRQMTSDLNLKQNVNSEFFKDWQERARKSKIGKKRPEHSKFMKKNCKWKNRIVSDKEKERMSERTKKWIKEKGHPRGMLGKKQTEKVKKISAENLKNAWKDKNNYINSKEHRQILSDRASKLQQSGIFKNRYSNSKKGTYNINGKKIFFRSMWEANYALYLDFLIKQKEIVKWEFEVDTFWFLKIKRGVRSYKPDFKVYTSKNKFEYHEVKGWMDNKSKTKLRRMKIYYPEVKMILIDAPVYKDIKNKLGRLLGFF